jgi:SAM-dependent methyltransferase
MGGSRGGESEGRALSEEVKAAGAGFWNANPCGGMWSSYREFYAWIRDAEPYIFRILDAYDWQGTRVLEVGCGQGTTANYLPPKGARVTGIDMSFTSMLQARGGAVELGHADRIRFSNADAERLPLATASFDRVISIGVLHHTASAQAGIDEIHRVLRPGGAAIVMLYRSGNPKWWATRTLRGASSLVDLAARRRFVIAAWLRRRRRADDAGGTALLELFGVPILNAYSNGQARRMFAAFADVRISNHAAGFRRLADVFASVRPLRRVLTGIDRAAEKPWGFYQVVEARKPV